MPRKPTPKVIEKALSALDGMEQVVRNEMLKRGLYVGEVENQELAESGAICGGRSFCAVGSLWVGSGVRVRYDAWGPDLPGTGVGDRRDFLKRRPGLRLAYDTLNEVSVEYINKHNLRGAKAELNNKSWYEGGLECMFEGSPRSVNRDVMLTVIDTARHRIKAMG